ncbi:MAG: AMP-binding protein [Bacilli bacterium]|nr:AMP-binding protein [Bacilli bacterium]
MKISKETTAAFLSSAKALLSTGQSMSDIFHLAMERCPAKTAMIGFDEEGKVVKTSYAEYKDKVFVTASKLAQVLSGTGKGTIIGLKLKNSTSWPIYFWALLMCGHNVLLIDAKLPVENAANLLKQSRARGIITNDEGDFGVPSFRINDVSAVARDYAFTPDWANHVIFCSSGTTGDAKMMIYDGKNLCNQVLASLDLAKESAYICHQGEINILAMIPLHHIFGFVAVFLWYTFYGKALVFPAGPSTSDLMYAIHKGKCTHIYSVPLLWDAIAQKVTRQAAMENEKKAELVKKMIAYNTGSISKREAGKSSWKVTKRIVQKKLLGTNVQFCISGGGYLSQKTLTTINGLGYPLHNGYGMTEIGVVCVDLSDDVQTRLKASIGHPFYGVEFRIGETGTEKTGQLYVKSAITHNRKFVGGVLTRNIMEDGYFPTGDIAEIDGMGGYHIKGRIKDTIILSNGENVYPDEIEYYFRDVKHVNNCVVLGVKAKGEAEEKITLVIEVDNSVDSETLKAIKADIDSINNTLQNEKKVQKVLVDRRPLPMANNMKVKRFVIKEGIEKGSDDYVDFDSERKAAMFEGYDPAIIAKYTKPIAKIFAKVLILPEIKIKGDAHWINDLGGDSMSYIEMAQTVDSELGVTIPEELYGTLVCLNDFVKTVIDLKGEGPKKEGETTK